MAASAQPCEEAHHAGRPQQAGPSPAVPPGPFRAVPHKVVGSRTKVPGRSSRRQTTGLRCYVYVNVMVDDRREGRADQAAVPARLQGRALP